MSDINGELRLTYAENRRTVSLSFGTVTGLSSMFQKSVSTTPLVSLPSADAFALDTKTTKVWTVKFTRVQPPEEDIVSGGTDSTRWSNAEWLTNVTAAVDRWQCRTDGFKLRFTPAWDNPYTPEIDPEDPDGLNGYVKSLSISYSSESNTTLSGSFEFHAGTMYVGSGAADPSDGVLQDDFQIQLSDPDQNFYLILGKDADGKEINCVKSYTMSGGLESPFEYISLKIPKDRLSYVAPELISEDSDGNLSLNVTAGRNSLMVSAVGTSTFTVSKCKLSDGMYTITGYCKAEALRGTTLDRATTASPNAWIERILTSGQYGVRFSGASLRSNAPSKEMGTLTFQEGQSVWYILQVAAMCLGCRVFFAQDCAYVVDYRGDAGSIIEDHGVIDLYPTDSGNSMYAAVTGTVSLGDEGVDTIINSQTIRYTHVNREVTGSGDDATTTVTGSETVEKTYTDEGSIGVFDTKAGNILYLTELTATDDILDPSTGEVLVPGIDQAQAFGDNFISYRSEPQQSIEFKVKEFHQSSQGTVWMPCFDPCSRATDIIDTVDDTRITNTSDIPGRGDVLQKLCLSSYERSYPEGTTTYTWGVMANIDLSSSTSQINTSLNTL